MQKYIDIKQPETRICADKQPQMRQILHSIQFRHSRQPVNKGE